MARGVAARAVRLHPHWTSVKNTCWTLVLPAALMGSFIVGLGCTSSESPADDSAAVTSGDPSSPANGTNTGPTATPSGAMPGSPSTPAGPAPTTGQTSTPQPNTSSTGTPQPSAPASS